MLETISPFVSWFSWPTFLFTLVLCYLFNAGLIYYQLRSVRARLKKEEAVLAERTREMLSQLGPQPGEKQPK